GRGPWALPPGGLLLGFEPAGVLRRGVGLPDADRARLYTGILDTGSWAAIVARFTLFAPAQWYGTNTTSGRIVATTWHRTVRLPRRLSTTTQSPSAMACWRARIGCSSRSGSGYWSTKGPMRRVWVPDRNMLTTRPVVRMTGEAASTSSVGGSYRIAWKRAFPAGK